MGLSSCQNLQLHFILRIGLVYPSRCGPQISIFVATSPPCRKLPSIFREKEGKREGEKNLLQDKLSLDVLSNQEAIITFTVHHVLGWLSPWEASAIWAEQMGKEIEKIFYFYGGLFCSLGYFWLLATQSLAHACMYKSDVDLSQTQSSPVGRIQGITHKWTDSCIYSSHFIINLMY